MTSATTAGTPNSDQLFVRALSFPEPYAMAIGFVVGHEDPSDGEWGRGVFLPLVNQPVMAVAP